MTLGRTGEAIASRSTLLWFQDFQSCGNICAVFLKKISQRFRGKDFGAGRGSARKACNTENV